MRDDVGGYVLRIMLSHATIEIWYQHEMRIVSTAMNSNLEMLSHSSK